MKRVAGILVLAAMALVTVGTLRASAADYETADEQHVADRLNEIRHEHGLAAVPVHSGLSTLARRQASRMAARGEIFHNTNLGAEADALHVDWVKLGENVGKGADSDQVSDAFEASPHHFDNIVDTAFNAVGVGEVRSGDAVYVVQVFANIRKQAPAVAPAASSPQTSQPVVAKQAPVAAAAAPVVAAPAAQPVKVAAPSVSDANAVAGGVVDRSVTF